MRHGMISKLYSDDHVVEYSRFLAVCVQQHHELGIFFATPERMFMLDF